MAGHGSLRQPEDVCQIYHPPLAVGELANDRQPVSVREAMEEGRAAQQSWV